MAKPMLRTFLFLLFFIAINVGAFFLGTQDVSKKIVSELTQDPQRALLNLIDTYTTIEQREILAEHLPRLYSFEYACRAESYDGKSATPVIAGAPEYTFTKEQPLLRCPRGLTASFEAGSKLRLHRKLHNKITWELLVGSGFLQATASDGIALQSGQVALLLDAKFPQFKLIFRSSAQAEEVLATDGEFSAQFFGIENKEQKEFALRSTGAQLEYQSRRLDPGANLVAMNGSVSLPIQSPPDRDKWVDSIVKQYGTVLPKVLVKLQQSASAGASKNASSLFVETVLLENPKCKAAFFTPEGQNAEIQIDVLPQKATPIDLKPNNPGLITVSCNDAKSRVFAYPVRVVAR